MCPSNVAFLRVQNGVHDPVVIGDKHKWFGHQLDSIEFNVWNDSNRQLNESFLKVSNNDKSNDSFVIEESNTESDISTSSSNSSLNEFITEMVNSELCNPFTGKTNFIK